MANAITARAATLAAETTAATNSPMGSSELGKQDFLMLLVAQLRNQDPMKPMEDKEFITQLAQFQSLETMMRLEQQMQAMTAVQVFGEAAALIGKTVEAALPDGTTVTGVVSEVSLIGDTPRLRIEDKDVDLSQIRSVKGGSPTTQPPAADATMAPAATAPATIVAGEPAATSPVGQAPATANRMAGQGTVLASSATGQAAPSNGTAPRPMPLAGSANSAATPQGSPASPATAPASGGTGPTVIHRTGAPATTPASGASTLPTVIHPSAGAQPLAGVTNRTTPPAGLSRTAAPLTIR